MMFPRWIVRVLALGALGCGVTSGAEDHDVEAQRSTGAAAAGLGFEENAGQFPEWARAVGRSPKGAVIVTDSGVLFQTAAGCSAAPAAAGTPADDAVWLRLDGASWTRPSVTEEHVTRSHYLRGSGPASEARHYGRVRYAAIYPGVDLVLSFDGESARYDFELASGAANDVRVDARFEHVGGGIADRPAILGGAAGPGSTRALIPGPSGPSLPPIARFALTNTFFGGTTCDWIAAVTTDPAGNVVISGHVSGGTLPSVPGGFDTTAPGRGDVYVAKLSADLRTLLAVTYIGGIYDEKASAVGVDIAGNVYVSGGTTSPDLPTTPGALQRSLLTTPGILNGPGSGFVAKLSPNLGSLLYLTYVGGSAFTTVQAMALDRFRGEVYITGDATMSPFPASSLPPAERGPLGLRDVFVARLNAAGSAFVFATMIGGHDYEKAGGIAIDGRGGVYVAGTTYSANFPVRNALQPTHANTNSSDAFLVKMNEAGTAVSFATYLGGTGYDSGRAVAVDEASRPIVVGRGGSGFPVANAIQPTHAGLGDAFVARLAADGSSLDFSTLLGGSAEDEALSVASDAMGRVHVLGGTLSAVFPTASAVQPAARRSFFAILNPDGRSLDMSTYVDAHPLAMLQPDREAAAGAIALRDGRAYFASGRLNAGDPVSAGTFDTTFNSTGTCHDGVVGVFDRTSGGSATTASFESTAYQAHENDLSVTVAVTRSGLFLGPASVDLVTIAGSASATTDFVHRSTTLAFAQGQRRATVTIKLRLDNVAEWTEHFYVTMRRPVGVTLRGQDYATVTILDGVPQ